jgi:hypothetical protein
VSLHGSRHCAASLLADLGVPDVAAAAWPRFGFQHIVLGLPAPYLANVA